MTQEQRLIPLVLSNGALNSAVATGNNASWHCSCERILPLIGKSGQIKGPSENTSVECPDCKIRYFVEPDGGDYKRAVRVVEL
ncbi:hypothetical protein SAMN05421686_1241 [Thalassolituus maritimus]|jgi:DNA-directed RNA polymerase subunit RPC12/RpoP|uniref:Uncharacterized protein n=1 Tax=Thalassolituus maritimus TaxID=484498 RepID=A0A1N7QD76_9GAMM|nr:hypothetical protein SAMN05421686_1241 [Thalassolituus maritimus]